MSDKEMAGESTGGEMTVGQLVERLQSQGLLGDEGVAREAAGELEARILEQNRADERKRADIERVVGLVGASPRNIQVKFLKGLAQNPDEAKAFMEDPRGYSKSHGVLLEPKLVRGLADSVLHGDPLPRDVLEGIGAEGIRDVLDMRGGPGGVAAWPAAVAAIAAVVSAAAAVVTAVTAVTSDHTRDILALKGLGPHGVRLPGGLTPMPGGGLGGGGAGPGPMPGPDSPIFSGGSFGR